MSMTTDPHRQAKADWARLPSPEERAAELARIEREVATDVRRAFVAALAGCVVSLLAGLALMAWALHTTDPQLGEAAFLGGLIVGYAGITVTLARYYLRGERDGWW
jgi:hypothetical protein